MESNFSCVTDCYDNGVPYDLNYYKFNSSNNLCVQICPNGFYGDPILKECVAQCDVGWYSLGNFCVQQCASPS